MLVIVVMISCTLGLSWLGEGEARARRVRERQAIQSLKEVIDAERIVRDGGNVRFALGRYGTLAELARARLIDDELASGTKKGYAFTVAPSATTSEWLWFATANPFTPGATGERSFATNHSGYIFFTTAGSIGMNTTDCTVGTSVQPIDK